MKFAHAILPNCMDFTRIGKVLFINFEQESKFSYFFFTFLDMDEDIVKRWCVCLFGIL